MWPFVANPIQTMKYWTKLFVSRTYSDFNYLVHWVNDFPITFAGRHKMEKGFFINKKRKNRKLNELGELIYIYICGMINIFRLFDADANSGRKDLKSSRLAKDGREEGIGRKTKNMCLAQNLVLG